MDGFSPRGRVRRFRDILVHPVQELLTPSGAFFRGGPDWPRFPTQFAARHCWGAIPWPIDEKPHPEPAADTADAGIWCGPITSHFGHMIADFGMRIAASGRLDPETPLVFSLRPHAAAKPPGFFWEAIDHLGIERRRVMLVRRPTRFARLSVLPQAERQFGGRPSRRHLDLMDAITAAAAPADRDLPCLYVSRSARPKGRFAAEAYLDEVLTAAGVRVFHPETVDLHAQFRLYRRPPCLIFSEGSAAHALQLLGRLDADIAVLTRRPGYRIAAASLRARARSLRYLQAARGLVAGLQSSGRPQPAAGISILDERRCLAGFAALGVDLARYWEGQRYAARRDADIAAWIAARQAGEPHPRERAAIEAQLRSLVPGTRAGR